MNDEHNVNYLNDINLGGRTPSDVYGCNFTGTQVNTSLGLTPNREFHLPSVEPYEPYHYFVCGLGRGYHCFKGVKAFVHLVDDLSQCSFHPYIKTDFILWEFGLPPTPQFKCIKPGSGIPFNSKTIRSHNVNRISKADFESCTVNNPTPHGSSDPIPAPGLQPGYNYYACGIGGGPQGHCGLGNMKAIVYVTNEDGTDCPKNVHPYV